MSTNSGDNLTEIVHAGTYGNKAHHQAQHNLASEVANDIVRLAKIPSGTKITDMRLIHEDVGAGRTLDIGYIAVDPDSALVADPDYFTAGIAGTAATDVAAAGSTLFVFQPYTAPEDLYLIATLAGADGTDKEIDVMFDSVYMGNL